MMRVIQSKSLVCGLALNVLWGGIGCQPSITDTQLASTSVAATEVAAPAASSEVQGSTSEPDDSAVKKTQKTSKIEVELKSLQELLKDVTGVKGKWTVVDVWSTSCVPCMKEFPHLVALSKKYPDKVRCVSVNVDYVGLKSKPAENYVAAVEDFLQKQNAEFKNYLSTTPDSDVFTELEIESIPAVMVFGPDGERKKTFTDDNSGDDGVTYEGDVVPWLENELK